MRSQHSPGGSLDSFESVIHGFEEPRGHAPLRPDVRSQTAPRPTFRPLPPCRGKGTRILRVFRPGLPALRDHGNFPSPGQASRGSCRHSLARFAGPACRGGPSSLFGLSSSRRRPPRTISAIIHGDRRPQASLLARPFSRYLFDTTVRLPARHDTAFAAGGHRPCSGCIYGPSCPIERRAVNLPARAGTARGHGGGRCTHCRWIVGRAAAREDHS